MTSSNRPRSKATIWIGNTDSANEPLEVGEAGIGGDELLAVRRRRRPPAGSPGRGSRSRRVRTRSRSSDRPAPARSSGRRPVNAATTASGSPSRSRSRSSSGCSPMRPQAGEPGSGLAAPASPHRHIERPRARAVDREPELVCLRELALPRERRPHRALGPRLGVRGGGRLSGRGGDDRSHGEDHRCRRPRARLLALAQGLRPHPRQRAEALAQAPQPGAPRP